MMNDVAAMAPAAVEHRSPSGLLVAAEDSPSTSDDPCLDPARADQNRTIETLHSQSIKSCLG